jgi:uncharacterized protein (TIGR04255 family)
MNYHSSSLGLAVSSPHPTYPKPTIAQVTCEIAFASQDEVKLSAAVLYPIFSDEFPEIQPIQSRVQVVIANTELTNQDPPQSPNAGAFRFATTDGKRFVQISRSNFIYQTNEQYPGWEHFRTKLLKLWSAPVMRPTTITKVGLRYVNRIIKTKKGRDPSYWFQPTADLPAALLSSKEHFLGRIESSPLPSHLRLVTFAAEPPGPDWPLGTIVMDIDRITTKQFASDEPRLVKNLELLHDDIWTSFDSAGSKNLKKYLSGKLK